MFRIAVRPVPNPPRLLGSVSGLGRATGNLGERGRGQGRGPNVTLARSSNVAVAVC